MLLVLGRPGSGCSTFLKVLGNQRAGFESIDGTIQYGGTDSEKMAKQYRSEGMSLSKHVFQFAQYTSSVQPRG
jgi:ABC-type multidrug transport system ATPase subunit